MRYLPKILLVMWMLASVSLDTYADRGGVAKKKKPSDVTLKPANSKPTAFNFNLTGGVKYKGNLLLNSSNAPVRTLQSGNNAAITYQRGNTVYILPYKSKKLVNESAPNYTGVKLIIKP